MATWHTLIPGTIAVIDPHELFADRLTHAYRRSWAVFVHGAALAIALAGFLLTELPPVPVVAWFAFLLATMGYHSHMGKKLIAGERRTMGGINLRPLAAVAALAGAGWGCGAAFLPFVSPPLQILLILTLMAVGAASLPRMAALPAIHTAFMAGLFVPMLITLAIVFGFHNWMMIAVLVVIWAELTGEARKAHEELVELYSDRQSLENEAVRDKLTDIPNRRFFDTLLEREWRQAMRLQIPISLMMVDVDFFKKYNDRYGHQAGDECLRRVARALAGSQRRAGDVVARYGGEEFVVLLFHTPRDDARGIAEIIRGAVEGLDIPHQDSASGTVTVSMGGATLVPAKDDRPDVLVRAADAALYEAKAAGRNRVAWAGGNPPAPPPPA